MSRLFEISGRVHYGFILMSELARIYGVNYVSLEEISEKTGFISQGYLEEIAAALRQAGLIKGMRGRSGGYELARPPVEINMADIIQALEGPIRVVPCQEASKEKTDGCTFASSCLSKHAWNVLHERILDTVKTTTLADMLFHF